MNFKKIKTIIISSAIFLALFVFTNKIVKAAGATTQPTNFQYQMLETFPGFLAAGSSPDLPTMILVIYKFGIWTVGIAGLFMLTIGGFMYMTSAGNNARVTSAKEIIGDSILGIVAALAAYLIMYVINPDLTSINIAFTTVEVSEVGPGPSTAGSGNCKPITDNSNACSVDNLKKFAQSKGGINNIDDWATKASSICNAESSGQSNVGSKEGKCNGTSIAWGLFQINLSAHCPGAFQGKWTRGVSGGGCTVANPVSTFEACRANAINVTWNLNKMWELYNKKGGWTDWEVALNGTCKF